MSGYKVGDRVKIRLKPNDACSEYHGQTGFIAHGPDSEGGFHVQTTDDPTSGLRCVPEELTLITDKPPLHYRYTIDVDERGYAELMQLVMKYGTGTGEGRGTSTTTRIALADAQVRVA